MDKTLTQLTIDFAGGAKPLSLDFRIESHGAAQRWARCLVKACQESELYERNRWYNFPGTRYGSLESLAESLKSHVDQLNELHPGLITESVDLQNLQESINRLHIHFADSHLVRQRITAESEPLWAEFNNLLHAFEAVERSEGLRSTHEIPNASIVFTWKNNFRQALAPEDYDQFTIAKKFGTCYVNYCQVGRHLFEMFQAQDDVLSPEHIQPLRHLSADTYLWLGPSTGPKGLQSKSEQIESWFHGHKEFFEKLGLRWGDPQLAIGWIPVATLCGDFQSDNQKKDLLGELSSYSEISGCRVL